MEGVKRETSACMGCREGGINSKRALVGICTYKIMFNKQCRMCFKQATFGCVGGPPRFCVTHKAADMIDVRNRRCEYAGCTKRPTYGVEGQKVARFCKAHREAHMVDVVNNRCEHHGCMKQAICAFPGQKRGRFCTAHKLDDMIDIMSRRCSTPLCGVQANPRYSGYCYRCFIHTFPESPLIRNHKTKERAVVEHLREQFPTLVWTLDKSIGPSRRRPDLFVDLRDAAMIIEVDEHQHDTYECICENKRIMQLFQDVGMSKPIIVIRFNTDAYTSKDNRRIASCWATSANRGLINVSSKHRASWERRLQALSNTIRHYLHLIEQGGQLKELDTVSCIV